MAQAAQPTPYKSFTLSSGALCYGEVHNIWHGASQPIQGFTAPRPDLSGTIAVQTIEYNTAAVNGQWNAFQLIDQESNEVVGWFLTHAGTDPRPELQRILRVSGSPYEEDSGSHMNDDFTASEGVFVINRYDWSYYDERGLDDIAPDDDIGEEEVGGFIAIGIVDYDGAFDAVQQWREQRIADRSWDGDRAWLYCQGVYMFGRFGFNEDKTAARSFLFFSTNTDFSRTGLADDPQVLRRPETALEKFQRQLGEGRDFSGVEKLHTMGKPPDDCQGPYEESQYLLTAADIEAVHAFPSVARLPRKAKELGHKHEEFCLYASQLFQQSCDLINEMFLSWLDRCIVGKKPSMSPEVLFPDHEDPMSVDREAYRCFRKVDQEPISNVDRAAISQKIEEFLRSRDWATNDEFVASMYRVVEYLLLEATDIFSSRVKFTALKLITPQEIRLAVFDDDLILDMLGHSTVYWEGRS